MTETVFVEMEVSFTPIFDQLCQDLFDPYATSTVYTVPLLIDEMGTVATEEDGTEKHVEIDVWDVREPEPWTPGIDGMVHLLQARLAARHDQTYTAWTKGDGLALRAALEASEPPPWLPTLRPLDDCLCWPDGDDTGNWVVSEDCAVHGGSHTHPRQINPPQQRGVASTVTQMLPYVEESSPPTLLGLRDEETPDVDG